jgi:hypothetical protein
MTPFLSGLLLPFSSRADQAVGDGAEPEIYDQTPVELEWPVARQAQGRSEQEVRHIAEDNAAEGLNQIDQHRGFRHRRRWVSTMMRGGSFMS